MLNSEIDSNVIHTKYKDFKINIDEIHKIVGKYLYCS